MPTRPSQSEVKESAEMIMFTPMRQNSLPNCANASNAKN
jgi:hypothetical protein